MAYTLPNTILNGTTADAGQVEANFLALLAAANNSIAADGTIGPTAAIPWNSQNLTGVNTLGAVTLNVSGVTGLSGNVTVGGTLGVTGAATFASSITGVSAAFSSGLSALNLGVDANFILYKDGSSNPAVQFDSGDLLSYDRTANQLTALIGASGRWSLSSTLMNTTVPATFGSTGTFSGLVTLNGGAVSTGLSLNNSGTTDSIVHYQNTAVDRFTAGYSAANDTFYVNSFDNAGAFRATPLQISRSSGTVTTSGAFVAGGTIAGGGTLFPLNGDANCFFQSGSTVYVSFDNGDFLSYVRSTNKLTFFIGGVAMFSIDSSGNVIAKGNITGAGTP